MKIIDFVKKNKVPTIAVSVVLVAAVAVGVIFGVMKHKDNVEVKPFGDESSSAGSSSTISVPPIEDNSSKESTSSEESTSSASETIETNATPSKAESVSSKPTTTTTKPASSQPSNTTSSAPVTSTPSNSGGGNSGSSAPSNGGTTNTPSNSGGNVDSGDNTTETGVKCVKIGNTNFYVNLDSPYGICSKCGLNKGMIIPHEDYTCERCGQTCCDAAFFQDGFDGWVCPYCQHKKEREKSYCPNCGRVIGIEKGQCGGYTDPFTNKWVCQDN